MGRTDEVFADRRRLMAVVGAVVVVALIAAVVWRSLGSGDDEALATVPVATSDTTVLPPTTVPITSTTSEPVAPSEPEAPTTTNATVAPTTRAAVPQTTRPPSTTPPTRAPVPRVAVVGDSSAERLAPGIAQWGSATGQLVGVGNGSRVGCPMGRGGQMHSAADAIGPVNALCDWATTSATGFDGTTRPSYPALVAGWRPDLVVINAGPWDVADRMLPGRTDWLAVGNPIVDAWLLDEMTAATDLLASGGARVVWLTQPPWEGMTRLPPAKLYEPAADYTKQPL